MKVAICVCVVIGATFVLTLGAPEASALNVLIADDRFDGNMDFLVTALANHNVSHLDNTDLGNNPTLTDDVDALSVYDVVIFYGSGNDGTGRAITAAEQTALEAYIQAGGNLIATGADILGSPDDPRMADVVRSSTFGDTARTVDWIGINVDHFILNGPFGDYRAQSFYGIYDDHDDLTADTSRGAVALGLLVGDAHDKIVFTDLPAPGGSVGMWNGNFKANEWDPNDPEGDRGLAILRNWLAGLDDADGDGIFDSDDNCPNDVNLDQSDSDADGVGDACDDCPDTASGDSVDADGCSTDDNDNDGVPNDADNCADTPAGAAVDASGCPTGCCGASGPVAPLGLAVGMLLLSRFTGRRRTRRVR